MDLQKYLIQVLRLYLRADFNQEQYNLLEKWLVAEYAYHYIMHSSPKVYLFFNNWR